MECLDELTMLPAAGFCSEGCPHLALASESFVERRLIFRRSFPRCLCHHVLLCLVLSYRSLRHPIFLSSWYEESPQSGWGEKGASKTCVCFHDLMKKVGLQQGVSRFKLANKHCIVY
jgi:hypothetical protein